MFRPKLLLILVFVFFVFAKPSYADIETWQQGFTLRINKHHTKTQVDTALQEMQSAGVDFLTLSPGWIINSTSSANVDRKSTTATDELVIYTVNKAHEMGMRVMLKPHLDVSGGQWRASINPLDKNKFFENYTKMIMTYANIAQQTNAEQFCIGAELVVLTTNTNNTAHWKTLIGKVRAAYDGDLTYSANGDLSFAYDEFGRLPFWEDLDYMGVSFYRPMSKNNSPTIGSILTEWEKYERDYIKPRQQKVLKPLIFTEIGYRSIDGASRMPWDYSVSPAVDTAEQKDLYTGFFEFWKSRDYVVGVNFWEWDMVNTVDPKTNKDYTPQNKPVLETIKTYFEGTGGSAPAPLPQEYLITNLNRYIRSNIRLGAFVYSDRDYTVTNIPQPLADQEFILSKNSDKTINSNDYLSFTLNKKAYVYIAYDSRAKQIPAWLSSYAKLDQTLKTTDATFNLYQKEYESGEIKLGGNLASPASGANSNYIVIVSEIKLEDVDTPTPGPEEPTPTDPDGPIESEEPVEEIPTTGQIVLVNPENNDTMDGEKKLKIYIEGLSLSSYTATYNVDYKGRINMPNDSTLNYKQAKIDFDDWDWNNDGPYKAVIEARNLQGDLIALETITLYVDH